MTEVLEFDTLYGAGGMGGCVPNDNETYTYELRFTGVKSGVNYIYNFTELIVKSGTFVSDGETKEYNFTLNCDEWSDGYPRGGEKLYNSEKEVNGYLVTGSTAICMLTE